jgi:KDO2-lipid IV(A) lauroyltransferase
MRATLIKLFMRFCALLPLRAAQAIGATAGSLLSIVPSRSHRVTLRNLELCFPELPADERRRLAARALRETGRTAAETGALWLWPRERVLGLVRGTSGREALDEAIRAGRGAIIMTPHLGSWEMVGLYCSALHTLTSLYRPPRIAELGDFMRSGREHLGAHLVPTSAGGVRHLYRALERNEMVGLLPDQEPSQGGGIFVPFFGISAYTMTLLARLAQKNTAPVFFAYAERLGRGAGFHLHFIAADANFSNGSTDDVCAAMNAGVEACIRRIPEQYQWNYKRFRTRPEGEARFY